jgi:hypothetical protein
MRSASRSTTEDAITATAPTPQRDDAELRCAYHPNTPTRLRCGKCGKPICTKCAMTTAVGLRCRDCARVRPSVTYETDVTTLVRALVAGVAAAVVIGAAWGLWYDAGLGPGAGYDWGFWFAVLLGFGVAEAISWAANRKRGVNLQLLGMGCILLGVAVSRFVLNARMPRPLGLDLFLSRPLDFAAYLHRNLAQLVFIILACAIAYVRFR